MSTHRVASAGRRRVVVTWLASTMVLAGALAGCSSTSDAASRASTEALPTTSTAAAPSPTTTTVKPVCPSVTGTLDPSLAGGPTTEAIKKNRKLVVGVDQNTPGFANRDENGDIVGFEIDMVRDIAQRLLGDPNAVQLVALPTADRLTAVQDGRVDMTVSLVTATCERQQQVRFSQVYFTARQTLLVSNASGIEQLDAVKGKRICATKGSTSIETIRTKLHARPYAVATRPECLVALQQGRVDAVTSDDTILAGFHQQDSADTRVLPGSLEPEPYAIAIGKDHPDLVQYVNAVLVDLRDSGRLEELRQHWLVPGLGITEGIPDAEGNLP
jgi:polar amino acid transport system substrate-binding protein